MTTIAPSYEDQAIAFAASVREQLADLPAVELDELLDGLQADLTERLADGGDLGDAAQYADELRQAAGLPPRDDDAKQAKRRVREQIRETSVSLADRASAYWGATSGRQAVRDFVLALRPLWWVLRGLTVSWLLLTLATLYGHPVINGLPVSLPGAALTVGLTIVSVQWGRGVWAPNRWATGLRRAAQVAAVVLVLPMSVSIWSAATTPNYVYLDEDWQAYDGLMQNGNTISNIFAFDCTGQPLDGVQLFDQNGAPITTLQGDDASISEPMWGFDDERQQSIRYERNGLAGYAGTWNVYPLQEARAGVDVDIDTKQARQAVWPTATALPLSPDCLVGTEAEADVAGE
jgi:hypothetical protein